MFKTKSKTVTAALVSSLLPIMAGSLLTACNKKEEKKAEPAPQTEAQEATAPADTAAAAAATAAIEVTGNDQMQFSTKTIEVAAGKEATIIFKNIGTMPITAMGHNLTILKPGTDLAGYANKAMAAKDTDYQPASEAASLVGATRLLGPGESDTLKVTLAAGDYPYLCTFPGHFAVMQGVLTAK